MTWLLLAFGSSITFGIGSFLFKVSVDRRYLSADMLTGLYFSGALLLLTLSKPRDTNAFSFVSLAMAIVIAIGSTLGNSLYLKVLKAGPASLSAPLVSCSNVLIIIMSVLFFDEQLSNYNLGGIAMLFIALGFLTFDPNEKLAVKDKRWYGLIAITILVFFLREGGLKIGQEAGLDTVLILFYAYVWAFLFNGFLMYRRGDIAPNTLSGLGVGVLIGLFSGGGLALYAQALTAGPASMIAPIFAARSAVVIFLATLLCKEKLSCYQTISVILLIGSVCLLCINQGTS